MKKLFLPLLLSLSLIASPAFAETAIGVVNVVKIMQSSKAANSVRSQLQAKQKSFQSELNDKAKSLRAEDQALVKQGRETAEKDKAEFEKKVKTFQEKAAGEERAIQGKKAALDKAFTAALEDIQKNMQDIVKQVAAEKKLNLVVSSAQVLYNESAADITDEVLKRLDAKLPNVTVKF